MIENIVSVEKDGIVKFDVTLSTNAQYKKSEPKLYINENRPRYIIKAMAAGLFTLGLLSGNNVVQPTINLEQNTHNFPENENKNFHLFEDNVDHNIFSINKDFDSYNGIDMLSYFNYDSLSRTNTADNVVIQIAPFIFEREEANEMSRIKKVYTSLAGFGFLSATISAIAAFVTPIFDPNMAKVFLPMSLVFLIMILFDYIFRGRIT